MRSDKKGFGGSIGGSKGAAPINSHALSEADGTNRRPDSEKGAGSQVGAYGHVPVSSKDPRVNSKEPPRKAAWGKVSSP